jgi:hypothetical protein
MDWPTIAGLATALGTLVLAIATFVSVRASQRAARIAERSLVISLRPVLVTSRVDDPPVQIMFGDGRYVEVGGITAAVEVEGERLYFAMPLRNAGSGLAVIQAWRLSAERLPLTPTGSLEPTPRWRERPELSEFRPQTRDLYVPAGDVGFWQGAVRDPDDEFRPGLSEAIENEDILTVDLLYGDHEGGQPTISRFTLSPRGEGQWLCAVTRHWSIDEDELE